MENSDLPVRIRGQVTDVKYVREEKSIVLIVRDPETDRCSKPIQISSSQFSFRPDQDVDDEMMKTAHLLRKYPHPINLVFEANKDGTTAGAKYSPEALDGPVIPFDMSF